MANYYLDISAIGNEYQAYADTPTTWGIPQDGNGKAGPGHSAAVAIATLDCTSAQGDGAQTLSILGVTVSDASAGSGATLAASLVTSINATATATTATYCQALLPLNKLIFARQNPGAMAQVQIMLRIAGTDWNTIAPTHAGFTTGPTITAFTGGVDGPFGYFVNSYACFGKAVFAYGLAAGKSPAPVGPMATNDFIYCRTKRDASDLTVSISATTAALSAPDHRNFIFDAGNKWAESGVFTLSISVTTQTNIDWSQAGSKTVRIVAESYGGFRYLVASTVAGSNGWVCGRYASNVTWAFINCIFEEVNSNIDFGFVTADGAAIKDEKCVVKLKSGHYVIYNASPSSRKIIFDGCRIEYSGLSADVPALMAIQSEASGYISVRDTQCIDVGSGVWKVTTPLANGAAAPYNSKIYASFYNVSGFRAASFSWPNAAQSANYNFIGIYQSSDGDRPMRFENNAYTTDWMDDGTYPTAGSLLPSGREWSIRCTWLTGCSRDNDVTPLTLYAYYRGSTAVKTVGVEFLASDIITPKSGDVFITVTYTDSTGVRRSERTAYDYTLHITGGDAPLAPGDLTWVMNGLSGFSAKKLELTTAYQVLINTEICVALTFCGTPASNAAIYVHPEPVIS